MLSPGGDNCGVRGVYSWNARLPSPPVPILGSCRSSGRTRRLWGIVSFDEADAHRIRHRRWQHRALPRDDRADGPRPSIRVDAGQPTRSVTRGDRLTLPPRTQRLLDRIDEPSLPWDEPRFRLPFHPRRESDRHRPWQLRAALRAALEQTGALGRHGSKQGMTPARASARDRLGATTCRVEQKGEGSGLAVPRASRRHRESARARPRLAQHASDTSPS